MHSKSALYLNSKTNPTNTRPSQSAPRWDAPAWRGVHLFHRFGVALVLLLNGGPALFLCHWGSAFDRSLVASGTLLTHPTTASAILSRPTHPHRTEPITGASPEEKACEISGHNPARVFSCFLTNLCSWQSSSRKAHTAYSSLTDVHSHCKMLMTSDRCV